MVFGCSAWKAEDEEDDATAVVAVTGSASEQQDIDAEVQSLRWLKEVVPLLLSFINDDSNTALMLSAIAVLGFLPEAVQQPQFKYIRDNIWNLLAAKSKHQVPAVRANAIKSIGSSFSAVGVVCQEVLQCILAAAEDGNVTLSRASFCVIKELIEASQVIVRQRAAWSLSNVISALCEHDAEGSHSPAVALQEFAVVTCATVRKCLNDNDKVLFVVLLESIS